MSEAVLPVGILSADPSRHLEAIRDAGGEPLSFGIPQAAPGWGVALVREWIADAAQVRCAREPVSALLLDAERPEELAGLLLAALRLDVPAVIATTPERPFGVALAAMGFAPLAGEPAEAAVRLAQEQSPRPGELIESFSLANALRAGLAVDGGPELLVHLLALAREGGVADFSRMVRVLAPENPAITLPGSKWFREHGAGGLLATLGDTLHDAPTVAGSLKEILPSAPPEPPEAELPRLVFVEGRVSGTEGVCRVTGDITEVSGECRVFDSEKQAVRTFERGAVGPESLMVLAGYGPRGGPGMIRLEWLSEVLESAGPDAPAVLTDGLAPEGAAGTWISLLTPEAAADGVIGRIRDWDELRIDLESERIRTRAKPGAIEQREPDVDFVPDGYGYAARYASSALPALEGAGFG